MPEYDPEAVAGYAVGQRWYSDNEPELGLGLITQTEFRSIALMFPATGEQRRYARDNAPLTRARFGVHDRLRNLDGAVLHVSAVLEEQGLLIYCGHDESGHQLEWPESLLDPRLQLFKPRQRLFNGQFDSLAMYQLRYETLRQQHQLLPHPAWGLSGARVSLVPHQLYIAHEVTRRAQPRVLLADEVGLGKTIEAGLILHHQLLNQRVQRVLVIVPETLQHQWLVEMLRRFNLDFSLFDAPRCAANSADGANPFLSEQRIICSLQMFMQQPDYQAAACAGQWDLLVVDEAHHLQWSPGHTSEEYRLVEQLAQQTPAVLLLTATPEQLGISGHFARLRLLDPARFFSLETFSEEEAFYQPVVQAANTILNGDPLSAQTRQALELALGRHPTRADLLRRIDNENLPEAERAHARIQLVHLLVDRHGTGRVLFRNTRAAIQGFPPRQARPVALVWPEAYQQLGETLNQTGQGAAWTTRLQVPQAALLLSPERVYRALPEAARAGRPDWTRFDPRVTWLAELAQTQRQDKLLVICSNADTALELGKALREQTGLRSGVFHEGMTIIERDRAAAYFAAEEQGAQLLICSEIGSEGRNFQFAHHLVLFDLPLNPDLLEQRIGRLDRIGQRHVIQIHIPYFEHSSQALLFRLYHHGLNAFEQTCPFGTTLFEHLQPTLERQLALAQPDPAQGAALVEQAGELHRQFSRQLEQGRDRLLELNSYRSDEADYIRGKILELDNDPRLIDYLARVCEQFGVDFEEHGRHSYILRPGAHMLVDHFPQLPADGVTLTAERATALAHENWLFLSWEHPMLQGVMDLVLEDGHGNTALSLFRHPRYRSGDLLLECIFCIECIAPPALQAHRFLPPTLLRLVIDPALAECSEQLPFEQLQIIPAALNKTVQRQIIASRQAALKSLLQQAEMLAGQRLPDVIQQARQRMGAVYEYEIQRLEHLRQVNPNIRDQELQALQQEQTQLDQYLQQSRLRLDALRLLIAG